MNISLREDRHRYRREREHPSFSSTLLDSIYRSIDEGGGGGGGEEELVIYRETMRKNCTAKPFEDDEHMNSLQRACMIGKYWTEKKVMSEKVVLRRNSVADYRHPVLLNSTSSSSDSSCGGGFSSSETESSVHGLSSSRSHWPKPIRTSTSVSVHPKKFNVVSEQKQKPKHEGGFVKTKSRALKIYGDLKKAKQPISPGGRLASFLNSLFTAGNAKKSKITSGYDDANSKSANASTCSSASSFSRSCLSRGKLSNGGGTKRSVRFCPVSVIVDENCQPCGHKSLYDDQSSVQNSINEEFQFHMMEKHRRIEEAARDLLRNYQKKVVDMRNVHSNNNEASDDDEDDAASYASSDLFELDNLSPIGIERYREELPVYETTHLDTNRAIANGFIL
uniref:Protein BIG GRAIN 1-like A n=1 Tax=Davidia involucrata TaxID=16924 RepID=A0A5B7AUF5_DAVIN